MKEDNHSPKYFKGDNKLKEEAGHVISFCDMTHSSSFC